MAGNTMFNSDHYERQYRAFWDYAAGEGFGDEDTPPEVHDHVSEITIPVATTTNPHRIDFLEDDSNPLVLSDDPVMIKRKSAEIDALIGFYAIGLELDLGPNIADAEVADLNSIVSVMSQAKIEAFEKNNTKRWSLRGSRIITSRAGIGAGTNNAAVMLSRGAVDPGPELRPFPTVRLVQPGTILKEQLVYDGSKWASAPVVGANFKVARLAHIFVARRSK